MQKLTKDEMLKYFLSGIRVLAASDSKIDLLFGSILICEIRLKEDSQKNKILVCENINDILKLIDKVAKLQIIIAVIDDEDDKYVRIIGKGIQGKELEVL